MTAKLIKVTMVNGDPLFFAHEQFVSVRSLSVGELRDLASFAKTTVYPARSEMLLTNGSPLEVREDCLRIVALVEDARDV